VVRQEHQDQAEHQERQVLRELADQVVLAVLQELVVQAEQVVLQESQVLMEQTQEDGLGIIRRVVVFLYLMMRT
jgi:hypothetical protein